MTSQDFKLSKIQIIIKDNGDDEEEEEQGPKEVPMFDQTMSILTMIKDQKVIFNFLFLIFLIFYGFSMIFCRKKKGNKSKMRKFVKWR